VAGKKKSLSHIKTGALSRSFSLAKMVLNSGARAATHAVGNLFSSEEEKAARLSSLLAAEIDALTRELGHLKGSLMKAGQMLSIMGEHFLPAELNTVLKSLQSQSPPLEWQAIERQLIRQLGRDKMALLNIDPEPSASASLGQVHRATLKSDSAEIALKIQYPGVDQAIEGDLRALKSLLRLFKMIPKGPNVDEVFKEIRQMLHQEVDYQNEIEAMEKFRNDLTGDARYLVPRIYPEFSTRRVIATSFEEGAAVDGREVAGLSQKRRNAIAEAVLDLYFRELFAWNRVQTDPHFGNYRIRLGKNDEPDRVILFDFGAVRSFPKKFMTPYIDMIRAAATRDDENVIRSAIEFGLLIPDDAEGFKRKFCELAALITEPFQVPVGDFYDFASNDLPRRVARKAGELVLLSKLRAPPRELVFLDRKMGGMFVFLSVLKARLKTKDLLRHYLAV
jgi:predicted unusual protein kinase regulating ubiquinone biosynthesis (AarF/ABC1/UbiB family)